MKLLLVGLALVGVGYAAAFEGTERKAEAAAAAQSAHVAKSCVVLDEATSVCFTEPDAK